MGGADVEGDDVGFFVPIAIHVDPAVLLAREVWRYVIRCRLAYALPLVLRLLKVTLCACNVRGDRLHGAPRRIFRRHGVAAVPTAFLPLMDFIPRKVEGVGVAR